MSVLQEGLSKAVRKHYDLSGRYTAMPSEWGGTFKLTTESGESYLVKYLPSHVPQDRIQLENAVLQHLQERQLPIQTPAVLCDKSGSRLVRHSEGYLRVMHWVQGRLWHDVNPRTTDLASSLGSALGVLKAALRDYSHPSAYSSMPWAPHEVFWTKREEKLFDGGQLELFSHFQQAINDTIPLSDSLRQGVNYNDANDYNIIVGSDLLDPKVIGFIDFGDVQHGPEVNDLAICLAYAMQGSPDPMTIARHIVAGYHQAYPLSEKELTVLYALVIARLLISVTFSALRAREDPTNDYWQVSDEPAWDLLRKMKSIPEHLALCTFRDSCGFEPSPHVNHITHSLLSHADNIYPVLGETLQPDDIELFDWSVGSSDIHPENPLPVERQSEEIFNYLEKRSRHAGIGRYNEPRIVYSAGHYTRDGLNGPERRTIHLGVDIFMPAGTQLFAPLDGKVIANCADPGSKGYGHLLILEHHLEGETFYTLYGHNSRRSLSWPKPGDIVKKGKRITEIGASDENGGWIPHLHFQIITHMLDYTNDFPGVANPAQRSIWLSLCPNPNLILRIDHPGVACHTEDVRKILTRRETVLAPNLSLVYEQPLHVVRGWKTTLFQNDGVRYLDTCNNIAHVGHEHPEVVSTGQRQLPLLNTNTRYVHKEIIGLAEDLLETLPSSLSKLYFVNSGSEANDLALRMARVCTGSRQTIVLDHAYHGVTQACLEASPYKWNSVADFDIPDYIRKLPLPDTYRADPGPGDSWLAQAKAAFTTILAEGSATFIHETLPSCAGQITPPREYFKVVYEAVRAEHGICIADEVQTGLGRVGSHYWAFELYEVQPDIVTMGKPLGNGHPVAAVAVTQEVAEAFDNGMEFFSSFGGNPVSCAIARAVIRVIETEHLQEHALRIGNYWREALEQIAVGCSYLGDVRGFGLFLGIEFSKPGTTHPAPDQAAYVIRRLLDHKILASLDGPDHNVIKIKPPMCITRHEVDYFLEVLTKICCEDALLHS